MLEPHPESHRAQSLECTDCETEPSPTAAESAQKEEQEQEKEENVDKNENPHILRHIGVPVMGTDLLAEMKARQERMAVKKVGGAQEPFFLSRGLACTVQTLYKN